MKIINSWTRFAIIFFLFCLLPYRASAMTLGISPSVASLEILVGGKSEQTFVLSRDDTSSQMNFTVLVDEENSEFINTLGQKNLFFDIGEDKLEFPYVIDTKVAELGEYESKITFVLQDGLTGTFGSLVQLGISGKIKFSVVDELSESTRAIDVSNEPEVYQEISISNFKTDSENVTVGDNIVFSWDTNNGNNFPVKNAVYKIKILRNDISAASHSGSISEIISEGSSLPSSYTYTIPENFPEAEYSVVLSMGDFSESLRFKVVGSPADLIIFASILFFVLLIIFLTHLYFNKKKKKRSFLRLALEKKWVRIFRL